MSRVRTYPEKHMQISQRVLQYCWTKSVETLFKNMFVRFFESLKMCLFTFFEVTLKNVIQVFQNHDFADLLPHGSHYQLTTKLGTFQNVSKN